MRIEWGKKIRERKNSRGKLKVVCFCEQYCTLREREKKCLSKYFCWFYSLALSFHIDSKWFFQCGLNSFAFAKISKSANNFQRLQAAMLHSKHIVSERSRKEKKLLAFSELSVSKRSVCLTMVENFIFQSSSTCSTIFITATLPCTSPAITNQYMSILFVTFFALLLRHIFHAISLSLSLARHLFAHVFSLASILMMISSKMQSNKSICFAAYNNSAMPMEIAQITSPIQNRFMIK